MDARFDAFAGRTLLDETPLDDATLNRLWVTIIDTFGFRPSLDTLARVLDVEAHNRTFHPVADYLNALTWDGEPRLDAWLVTYGGAADTAYVRVVGALVLIAAVRRVRCPGCKFDELLVLESEQGTLKSTAIRTLCPDDSWFSDDLPLGEDSKSVIERTAGRWIVEASEMQGYRGRESERLKGFLSRQTDAARLAYARLPIEVPRQFIIIGTTNSSKYLKDHTGSRRFWPVRVERFIIDQLRRDRDQLWAEAAAREAQGESIRLPQDLWKAAGDEQEQRFATDPWEAALYSTFFVVVDGTEARVDEVAVADVWKALGVEVRAQDNRAADRLEAIAQRFGFRKTRAGKDRRRVWVPASESQC